MDEVRQDYFDQLHEQNLIRHGGRTTKCRGTPLNALPEQPVTVIVYPKLDSLSARIRYLQGKENAVDFCKRAAISMKAYYSLLRGSGETNDKKFVARIAHKLGCPEKWLLYGETEKAEAADTEAGWVEPKEKAEGKQAECAQLKRNLPQLATLGKRLDWLAKDKSIQQFCKEVGISSATFYRYKHTGNGSIEVLRQLAEKCAIPLEWLAEGCVEDSAAKEKFKMKDKSGTLIDAKDNTNEAISLSISGRYEAGALAAMLMGFGNHILRVQIELENQSSGAFSPRRP